jgi:hypothetical protein
MGRTAAVEITPSARRQLAQRARAYLLSNGMADAYNAETARLYVVEGDAAPEYRKGGSMAVSGSSRRYFEPKIEQQLPLGQASRARMELLVRAVASD